MSYEKHTWETGETIMANTLNNLEEGIGENNMSYEKHTWSNGEVITADKLNHMEDGIGSGGGGSSDFAVATVTVIPDGIPDGVEMADAILTGEITLPFYVAEEQKYICQSVMTQNGILQILMYHNIAAYAGSFEVKGTDHKDYIQSNAPICTGGVIYDEDEEVIIISGDGTITVPVIEDK